jgi:hypothetical protein
MKFFFNTELPDHGLHSDLNAAFIKGSTYQMGIFQTPLPIGKEELGMPMESPEVPQNL